MYSILYLFNYTNRIRANGSKIFFLSFKVNYSYARLRYYNVLNNTLTALFNENV